MWWYYKCVNLIRVLIQGSKVILFVTWECLARASLDVGGAPPHTDNLIRSAAGGRRPNRTVEKTRRVRVLALSSLFATLWCSWTRNCALKRAQGWPGSRPAGLSQRNQPQKSKTVPKAVTPRTQRLQRRGELSWWRHATWASKVSRATRRAEHVAPETKNSRGKTKPTSSLL